MYKYFKHYLNKELNNCFLLFIYVGMYVLVQSYMQMNMCAHECGSQR